MTTSTTEPDDPIRSLLHEWFVEYNPTYLFSAALVLAGLTLVSCDLASYDAMEGLGLSLVSELYALGLIGGAALLRRVGHRRVAVMVGLLAAVYQCDVTMHVERSAFLGGVGVIAAALWALLFYGKLVLLARALGLRPSRSALRVPTFGAAVVAMLPQLRSFLGPLEVHRVIVLSVFAVGACALWTTRAIESDIGFDYRGRRALRGTWILWAVGFGLHVLYAYVGSAGYPNVPRLAPVFLILATRIARSERGVWACILVALGFTFAVDPTMLSVTAVMTSIVLVLRALRSPSDPEHVVPLPPQPTYRGAPNEPNEIVPTLTLPTFAFAARPTRERMLLGAMWTAHLAAWTAWVPRLYGPLWLSHVVWLDLLLLATCLAWLWSARRARMLTPILPVFGHWLVQSGTVRPSAPAEYGAWAIAIGFALLGGSLAFTWWDHRTQARE